jgi:hypothetical protein
VENKNIKNILVALAGIVAVPLMAQGQEKKQKLVPLESLPADERTHKFNTIKDVLERNPTLASNPNLAFGVDSSGIVYAIDKTRMQLLAVGAPSCITNIGESQSDQPMSEGSIVYVDESFDDTAADIGNPSCITW